MDVKHARYSDEAVAAARKTWGDWSRGLGLSAVSQQAATDAAVGYLELGLSAGAVAALVLTRLGGNTTANTLAIRAEDDYLKRAIADAELMVATGVITQEVGAAVKAEYAARGAALDEWSKPLVGVVAAAAVTAVAPPTTAIAAPAVPAEPPPPPFSLRDMFAENSVLLLAALGAFLLVVATVLFELYATT